MRQPTACPRCGQRPRAGARFCTRCGLDLPGTPSPHLTNIPAGPPRVPPPAIHPSLPQQIVAPFPQLRPTQRPTPPKAKKSGCGCLFLLLFAGAIVAAVALPPSFWKAQVADVGTAAIPARPNLVLPTSPDTLRIESPTATLSNAGGLRNLLVSIKLHSGKQSPVIVAVYPIDARDEWYGSALPAAAAKKVTFSTLATFGRRNETVDVALVVPSSALPYPPAKVDIVVFSQSGQALRRSTVTVNAW